MPTKIPHAVRIQVKEVVYRLADEFSYMNKSRVDNGEFMDNLIGHREVGIVLAQYMAKGVIKTYIKDAVLNRYMKDKRSEVLSDCESAIAPIVEGFYGQRLTLIEKCGLSFLFRMENGEVLVVSQGTWLKWETALRKALEIISSSPGLSSPGQKVRVLLNIALLGSPSTSADRDQLRGALDRIGVEVNFADCED